MLAEATGASAPADAAPPPTLLLLLVPALALALALAPCCRAGRSSSSRFDSRQLAGQPSLWSRRAMVKGSVHRDSTHASAVLQQHRGEQRA